jgi:hypothetical protein
MLGGGLLVGMNEVEERLSDEGVCLFLEMTCEDGIHIDELKVGGEKSPVCNRMRVEMIETRETIVRGLTTTSFADFRQG